MKQPAFVIGVLLLVAVHSSAQSGISQRIPLIGSNAPSFHAPSTNGKVCFPEDFGDQWKILFSHPRDFTPEDKQELKKADPDVYYINWYMIYRKSH